MSTSLRISAFLLAASLVAGACQSGGATTTPTAIPTATPTLAPHGVFSSTRPMLRNRWEHTATLLPSGKVLITGGFFGPGQMASAELYDPSTDSFTATGPMASVRVGHTATLLTNGKVLITGGGDDQNSNVDNLASAELYDPGTGSFSATGSMPSARTAHTATLLANGKVLITGGLNGDSYALASSELYDPATGSFSSTGSMSSPRWWHAATLLPGGKVLITGGYDGGGAYQSAELYDPGTGSFSWAGFMTSGRMSHTATLLASGKVLITGGTDGEPMAALARASAELYDPDTGSFSSTGSMTIARSGHSATLLASGAVLVAGGDGGGTLPSAELYTP